MDKTFIKSVAFLILHGLRKEDREMIKEVIEDIQFSAKCITFEDISEQEKTGDHIR